MGTPRLFFSGAATAQESVCGSDVFTGRGPLARDICVLRGPTALPSLGGDNAGPKGGEVRQPLSLSEAVFVPDVASPWDGEARRAPPLTPELSRWLGMIGE